MSSGVTRKDSPPHLALVPKRSRATSEIPPPPPVLIIPHDPAAARAPVAQSAPEQTKPPFRFTRAHYFFGASAVVLVLSLIVVYLVTRKHASHAPHTSGALAPTIAPVTPIDDDSFPGVLLAPASVDIAPTIDGRLAAVAFKTGDRVEKGATVARLDDRLQKDALRVAQAGRHTAAADAARARIEMFQAKDRQVRRDAVVKVGDETLQVVSAEEAAQARFATQAAASRVVVAGAGAAEQSARVKQLETAVVETQLRAPFAGVVAARYADPGGYVHAGQPVLRVIATTELRVRFAVAEDRARQVAVGDAVTVVLDGRIGSAKVEAVAPEVEAASRTVFVEASLRDVAGDAAAALAGRVVRVKLREKGRRP